MKFRPAYMKQILAEICLKKELRFETEERVTE